MAEIDVERSGTSAWPWVLLGLLVLGIVIWAVTLAVGGFIEWPWVVLGLLVAGISIWAVAQALRR